jgi:hypothetical protein
MCSSGMLPPPGELRRKAFDIVRDKNLTLHFVFDRVKVGSEDELRELERNERLIAEIKRANASVDVAVLREFAGVE